MLLLGLLRWDRRITARACIGVYFTVFRWQTSSRSLYAYFGRGQFFLELFHLSFELFYLRRFSALIEWILQMRTTCKIWFSFEQFFIKMYTFKDLLVLAVFEPIWLSREDFCCCNCWTHWRSCSFLRSSSSKRSRSSDCCSLKIRLFAFDASNWLVKESSSFMCWICNWIKINQIIIISKLELLEGYKHKEKKR